MLTIPNSLNLTLAHTPIIELHQKKQTRIWLKRDDMTGIELSGNKIRKLDFLLQDALEKKAVGIITCGAVHSNHCRAAAYAATKVGLETILYLRGTKEDLPTGNHFLNLLLGVQIFYVSPDEYENIDSIMRVKSGELSQKGKHFYVIPEGGSNEVGAWGYIKCFNEILGQIEEKKYKIDAVAVATGSGGTHAGLFLGKLLNNSSVDIISINVCDNADFFRKRIYEIIKKFEDRYNKHFDFDIENIMVFDGFTGEGYGMISKREIEVIKQFVKEVGIILDPVYTAKAFLGLEKIIEQGIIHYNNILFIHTGGIFGVFPYVKEIL